MSLHPTDDVALDHAARAAHAQSLDHLSPRVHAQLAQRRRGALSGACSRPPRKALPWAAAASAGLALALVMQLHPPSGMVPADEVGAGVAGLGALSAPRLAVVESEPPVADLYEDPDFYLWLGESSAGKE